MRESTPYYHNIEEKSKKKKTFSSHNKDTQRYAQKTQEQVVDIFTNPLKETT
jgi:hypothetical protein